jgi:hypothetical protein
MNIYKGNNGSESEAELYRHHGEEKTTKAWPRQKDVRGENIRINYGMDTTEEKENGTSKKNMDGRSTSSHDNKEFRTRSIKNREEWRLVSGRRRQLLKKPNR